MYIDLWVATDGITTVRFSDQQSAEIYCAQTGWNVSDLQKIRQQVTVSSEGAITVEPWRSRMDPNVECEVQGTWSEDTYIPPQNSMADGSSSEDDAPVVFTSQYLRMVGSAATQLHWDFRDLLATESDRLAKVLTYVAQCNKVGKNPQQEEAVQIIGRYAD